MAEPAAPAAPAPAAQPAPAPTDIIGRLDRILAPEAPPEQPQPQTQTSNEVPPEQEEPTGPNKQVEGDQPPPEQAPDDRPAHEISLDDLEAVELEVKWKDGEKDVVEKRSIKELRDGYMKDADYRRKTTDLARQREQLPAEISKAVAAERVQYVKELQAMDDLVTQVAATELEGVNWNDLSVNNPFEYVRLDNRKKQIAQAREAIKAKQQEVLTKHQAEQREATQKAAIAARTQLESDIPGWNDTLYQGLMKTAIEQYGYKPEEVAAWVDPRAFKLLHAATQGAKAKSETRTETPAPTKRVVVTPKTVKPGATTPAVAGQRQQAAMKQLQGSGKIADAAEVIRQRFG